MLIHLYAVHAWGEDTKSDAEAPSANGAPNGYSRVDRRVHDAEEFELGGLDSDDEDAVPIGDKERQPLTSRS